MDKPKPTPVIPNSRQEPPAGLVGLPFTDSKPVGAADFYFAINATFRFIEREFGPEGLHSYWAALGAGYFAPVTAAWKRGGLQAVADYWRAFFAAEPGSEASVEASQENVSLDLRVCPAFKHLRAHGRDIVSCFCQHCYYVSEAMATPAGLTVRVEGGNGACRQTFLPRQPALPPQDFTRIKEAA